ncbi:MAG: hypothetical protein HC799_07180 [Limnothrix sp. RL_2_0]|nr:hypothetical protein [Limnothrix sp. RL_2_0]
MLAKRDYPDEVLNDLTYWSLINEDYGLTETMFEQGADINHRRGEFNTTLLHNAMLYFPATATDFLLEKQIDLDAQDDLGRTAFHHLISYRENNIEGATEADILAIAEKLITAGADSDIADQNDQTALTLAETKGYDSIVQLLQKKDSDPSI